MNERPLESMVTHLVQCTCNSVVNCPNGNGKGLVQAKNLALEPITDLCNEEAKDKTSMTWNAILKDLLTRCCSQLCSCRDELVNIPRPLVTARWRETNDRKVLAPLALKHNTDNIIAGNVDMSRKRKSDVDTIWAPSKRIKLDDTLKYCSVVIKRTSVKNLLLQYKCASKKPFVKLFDILKEIPQEKEEEKPVYQNEFMGFLGLESKQSVNTTQLPDVKTSHPIKLVSNQQIPFSSDYGRRLLARERHCLPQDVALRKIERTEWYLKGAARIPKNNYKPEIVHDKKTKVTHTYKFPKRQFYQNHLSLQEAFVQYVCKPVCVELETIDITPYLAKKKDLEAEKQMAPNTVVCNGTTEDDRISISGSSSSANLDVFVVNHVTSASEVITKNGDKLKEAASIKNEESVGSVKHDCTFLKLASNNNNNFKLVNLKRPLRSCTINDSRDASKQVRLVRRSVRLSHTLENGK